MSLKAYRSLYRELVQQNKRIYNIHFKDEIKKHDALLKYYKMNLEKEKKSAEEIDNFIKLRKLSLQKNMSGNAKRYINSLGIKGSLREVHPEADEKLLEIVTHFLKSQRQYQELIERYNPGMTMSQEEKIKKTARRVGLDVPEY